MIYTWEYIRRECKWTKWIERKRCREWFRESRERQQSLWWAIGTTTTCHRVALVAAAVDRNSVLVSCSFVCVYVILYDEIFSNSIWVLIMCFVSASSIFLFFLNNNILLLLYIFSSTINSRLFFYVMMMLSLFIIWLI